MGAEEQILISHKGKDQHFWEILICLKGKLDPALYNNWKCGEQLYSV